MANIKRFTRTISGHLRRMPWPSKISGAPRVTTHPTIVGTVAPGQTVTRGAGTYSGTPTPTLLRSEWTLKNAAGAIALQGTGNSFAIPIDAPTGTLELVEIMVGVGALDARGRATASITAVTGLPYFTSNPTITGSSTVGQQLTRVNGAATGSPAPTITGEWLRDGAVMSPAQTGATYTTVTADIGKAITFRNKAENSVSIAAGLTIAAVSTGITITSNPATAAVITAGPTITYTAASTKFALSSITVAGTPTPTVTYLWHTASSATATLVARDQGATLTPTEWVPNPDRYPRGTYFALQATASNGIGTPDVKMSARVMFPALEGFTAQPSLSGSAPRGSTLTLDPGTWHGSPSEIEYQWYRAPSTGDPIRLSTSTTTRKTGNDDEGNTIKCRVRIKYASGSEFFAPSATTYTSGILVTAAVNTVWPAIDDMANTTSSGTVLQWSPSSGHFDFRGLDYQNGNTGYLPKGGSVQNDNWESMLGIIGYEAWRGNTVAQTRCTEWLKRWSASGTGNDPIFACGYQSQHTANFAMMAAFAKATPAVWDAANTNLTLGDKNRITALMQIAAWQVGLWREGTGSAEEGHGCRTNSANATTIAAGSNPNISCAPSWVWYAAAWFLGGIQTTLDFLKDNDLDDIVDTLGPVTNARPNGYNLTNCYVAWTSNPSGASTNAQIQTRARKLTRQIRRGVPLTDAAGVLAAEIDHCCRLVAKSGVNNGAGLPDSEYYNGSDSSDYVSAAMTKKYPGHTKEGKMILDPATVNPTLWNQIKDKVGMIAEFDTNDGNPGRRSSITYAWKAHPSIFNSFLVMAAAGFIDPKSSTFTSRREKLFVAHNYMRLASPLYCGYDGVAHIYKNGKHGNANNIEPGDQGDMDSYAILGRLSVGDAVLSLIP